MAETQIIHVKLTPKASRNKLGEWETGENGTRVLRAYVTAVPEDGKANAALIALLAKEWKLPKSAITLLRGATDRNKTLQIEGVIPPAL